ncbi:WD repeat-containing protein 6 [Linnemannia hyalina]|uniref:WD repeat-containing protein 6 n=1 Tax=Linnemannia hyalina TaxID=64524 RepID=A0A9P7Y2C6_9FUNG|nr:WD repeat-containing protein 6 [Linnemannia hyalina]
MDSVHRRAQPVHLTTPVTALAYHDNDILLSGQGPYLKTTLISTAETLGCIHLGQDWKIHRIVMANVQRISESIEARLFMVFGAKSLKVLRLCVDRSSGGNSPSTWFQNLWNIPHFKDWIVDAQWLWNKADLPGEHPTTRSSLRPPVTSPPTSIAIGYAHNFVEIYQLPQDPFTISLETSDNLLTDDNLSSFPVVYSVQSEEHCTLFCGRFHNNTLEDLWFASGTVFCHALLWKVYHDDGVEAPVVKSLIGHEGILFGIRWNDDGNAVCTVSDDRSIRIWDITHPTNITHTTHFGHTARVWDCQIVGPYLISISEDASCRVWRNPLLTNAAEADDASDCLACWEGHEGKSAWGVAVSDHGVVTTGGGDGGIHLWRLDSIVAGTTDAEQNTKDVDLPTIATYFPDATGNEKEFVRDFVITSQEQSVYSTNTGYILVRDDEKGTWNTLFHSPLLKNYSSLESSTCGRVVVAGCLSGKLVIVSVTNEFEPLIAETLGGIKIQFVFVLDGSDRDNFRIVVFRANCTVGVFNLTISAGSATATCSHICDLRLPNNNKAIHAAYFSPHYNLVLLGSRDSTVLVYNLSQLNGDSDVSTTLDSIIDLKRCHGSETVSSILMVTEAGEGVGGKDRISVYSTGRDGSWTKYRFLGLPGGETVGSASSVNDDDDEDVDMGDSDNEGDDVSKSHGKIALQRGQESSLDDRKSGTTIVLQKIFRSKITRGWLEQVFIMDGELLLLGFFNKKLFVYNESKHFEIFSMHSGAANRRRWRFLTNNARLEHTRLMYHSGYKLRSFARQLTAGSELFKNAKLQNNFHGREVRQMRFLNDAQPLVEGAPAPIIFASGGEDCRLRMFQYIPYKTKNSCTALKPLCNLKPSVGSALRCMEWSCTSDPHSYLLFTGGAVESMRAWQVGMSIPNSYQVPMIEDHAGNMIPEHTPLSLGCLELAQCPHASEIMETRIMDLSVFKLDGLSGKHFVAAVYSDAAIRVWLFDEAVNSFVLAIDASHHAKCILQVSHLKLKEGGVLMFTAATDGKIAVWDITGALDRFLEVYSTDEIKTAQASSVGRERKRARRDHVQTLGTPAAEVSVHMSGVNGLFIQDMGVDGIVAVSGGDDNALSVTRIRTVWDAKLRTVKVSSAKVVHRNAYAHGSAIQAVVMINTTEVVTTSQDQMLTVWGLNLLEDGGADMHMLETQFVHVPDPSTMDTIVMREEQRPLVAIAGIGVQFFDIQK